jgi:hypothetical protein
MRKVPRKKAVRPALHVVRAHEADPRAGAHARGRDADESSKPSRAVVKRLSTPSVLFSTWDTVAGVVSHVAQSIMIHGSYGGFSFRAFCGDSGHSDEIAMDLVGVVGCARCRAAIEAREREIKAAAGAGV